MKGLIVEIFKSAHYTQTINKFNNCTSLVLIDPVIDQVFAPTDEMPAIKIVRRNIKGKDYVHAESIEPGNYAFGGSFVYCSDSRFSEINKYPIPLHDRQMDLELK